MNKTGAAYCYVCRKGNRMKVIKSFLCIAVVLSLCSCSLFIIRDKYKCPVDEVSSVQIIKLGKYSAEGKRDEYTIFKEIDDYAGFVERLNSMEVGYVWNDPRPLKEGDIVIKIDYLDGGYDLIRSTYQVFVRNEGTNVRHFAFNEKQFETLIVDYLR